MIEITEELALFLVGKWYTDNSIFNPIKIEGLWYIGIPEIEFCTNEEIKPLLPPL